MDDHDVNEDCNTRSMRVFHLYGIAITIINIQALNGDVRSAQEQTRNALLCTVSSFFKNRITCRTVDLAGLSQF